MNQDKLSLNSKLAYSLGVSTGRQFITALVSTYILVFLTDSFGVPAGAAGLIMFIATIWDAVNDPIIGTIADKTRTKWGKYRPYLLIVPIPLAIVSVLLFAAPDLPVSGRIAYAAVLYICYGMLVTAIEIPYHALLPTMTKNDKERNQVIQTYTFIASFVILISSSFTTNLVELFGKGDASKGYMILVAIAAICMIITSWIAFFSCKEKYSIMEKSEPILVELKKMMKHREILPMIVVWCMGCLGFQIMMASSVYYCLYHLCRPDLITTYMLTMSLGGMVGIIFLLPIFMKICKGSVKSCFAFTQLITSVCYIFLFVFGSKSLPLLFGLTFISSMFATMSNAFIPMTSVGMTDYLERKTSNQLNGTVAAIKGFSYKCGTALSNALIAGILAVTGYVAGNIGGQSQAVLIGINSARFLIPIVAGILVIVCLKFYPEEKK